MADDRNLETRIKIAERVLNSSFGISEEQEGKGVNRFLDLESLVSAYKEEISRKEISQQFLSIAKAIRNMRSSYLPVEFFINSDTGRFDADFVNRVSPQESYENAFMRMLGMPSVGLSEFGLSPEDSEIRSSESLKMIDPLTGEIKEVSYDEIKKNILDERQKVRSARKILIDNNIYNVSETSATELAENTLSIRGLNIEDKASLLGTIVDQNTNQLFDPATGEVATFVPTEINRASESEPYINPYTGAAISTTQIEKLLTSVSQEELQAKISNINQDFWKFSYLLIPPIQSVEISKSINEPDKIVASPFSNSRTRRVNDINVKSTLLESIIRIRLDKVSGSTTFVNSDETTDSDFSLDISFGNEDEKVEVIQDDYGILEALFILRLRSAISGLAHKLFSDIDIIINEIDKSRRLPVNENPNTGQDDILTSNEAASQIKGIEDQASLGAISEESLDILQQQKLIEDSILFLLGDNSEVLDLQSQTQRSSSVYNSQMMSGLISIVDVPRKRISSEVNRIIESRNKNASMVVDQKTQEIGTTLGTDIGIGTVDLAVFALALFTISEKSLLGLLSTAQYQRIKNGEFKTLLPEDGDKEDTVVALNELTQLVIDGYLTFINELEKDIRID